MKGSLQNGQFIGQNQAPGQQGPDQGQNQMPGGGPQNDKTYITFSSDGKNWQVGDLVAEHASVPDVIQLGSDVGDFKKDSILVYYIDFSQIGGPGTEQIVVVNSTNGGKSWSAKKNITISNKQNKGGAVDPSIVQLSDGRLRLYFFGSDVTTGDPGQATGPHKVYSAISSDGINFTVEDGVRFQNSGLTDPEIIAYNNSWYMYYSVGSQFKLATSSDGLNFTSVTVSGGNIGGVPGALAIGGGVRVWGCSQGLAEGFAGDGTNFTKEQDDIFNGQVVGVCDPAAYSLSDGRYVMVYKVSGSNPSGGQQPGIGQPNQNGSVQPPPNQPIGGNQ